MKFSHAVIFLVAIAVVVGAVFVLFQNSIYALNTEVDSKLSLQYNSVVLFKDIDNTYRVEWKPRVFDGEISIERVENGQTVKLISLSGESIEVTVNGGKITNISKVAPK